MPDELKRYERLVTIRSIVAGILILVATAALVAPDRMEIAHGLALGFTFSILKLRLLARSLRLFGQHAVTGDKRKATGYLMSRSLLNFGTVAVALLIAGIRPDVFNMISAAAGLFLTNAVIVGGEVFVRIAGRART